MGHASRPAIGYHPGMQHEVGASRGIRARFVLPGSQQRGLRSGSLSLFPARSQQAGATPDTAAQPVRAVRLAARSAVHPGQRPGGGGAILTTVDPIHWSPPRSRLRDRRGAATPWRG
jgi:hypothetical protein